MRMYAKSLVVVMMLLEGRALAQDGAPPPSPASASTPGSRPLEPGKDSRESSGMFSLAIERVGGLAYAKASQTEGGDSSASLLTMGVGVGTINPYAVPRVGFDYVLASGLSLGGSVGLMRVSGSTSNGSRSEDIGSIVLYTLTPRVGYRIPLTDRIDLTPRAGLTLAGASVSSGSGDNGASVFSVAIGADAPFAFRLTDSLHVLAGPAFDLTVAASYSQDRTGGATTTSSGSDIDGSLWSLQAWLGLGGYF